MEYGVECMKKWFLSFVLLMLVLPLLSGCGETEAEPVVTTQQLRIGILSDIHSNTAPVYDPLERVEKALRFFKEKGVDGIMITGDLLDSGDAYSIMQLQDVWLDVFPNNINDLTGERVEPLFVYGNHDEMMVLDRYWFDGIGSEYEDAWIKEIKGYQFVGVHYTQENGTLVQKLLSQAQALSADKPFFFAQHIPMANTVVGGYSSYGGHVIPIHDILKKSYNCVVFSGHTHVPITDERSIWQSTSKKDPQFTAVNCGTMFYGFLKDFCNIEINGDPYRTQQGIYMVVDGSVVTLERYSLTDIELTYENGVASIDSSKAKTIGVPWVFDAMDKKNRPYDYDDRAEAAGKPVFPEGGQLEITELTSEGLTLTIPAAQVDAPEGYSDVVQSYYIEIADTASGEVVQTLEVASSYHIDTEPERLNQPVTTFVRGLEAGKEYTISVCARECYQKSSDPIVITVTVP